MPARQDLESSVGNQVGHRLCHRDAAERLVLTPLGLLAVVVAALGAIVIVAAGRVTPR